MKKIIKNNRGITIVHALVSVLIFAVFSSIILSATSNNLKSAKSQKNYQQAYLSVSNAADLFLESIDGDYFSFDEYTGKLSDGTEAAQSECKNWRYVEKTNYLKNPLATTTNNTQTNYLSLFKEAYLMGNDTSLITTIDVKAEGTDTFTEKVACEIYFMGTEKIYVNFYLVDATNNDNYYMCLEIPILDVTVETPFKIDESAGPQEVMLKQYNDSVLRTYHVEYDLANVLIQKGRYVYGEE